MKYDKPKDTFFVICLISAWIEQNYSEVLYTIGFAERFQLLRWICPELSLLGFCIKYENHEYSEVLSIGFYRFLFINMVHPWNKIKYIFKSCLSLGDVQFMWKIAAQPIVFTEDLINPTRDEGQRIHGSKH